MCAYALEKKTNAQATAYASKKGTHPSDGVESGVMPWRRKKERPKGTAAAVAGWEGRRCGGRLTTSSKRAQPSQLPASIGDIIALGRLATTTQFKQSARVSQQAAVCGESYVVPRGYKACPA